MAKVKEEKTTGCAALAELRSEYTVTASTVSNQQSTLDQSVADIQTLQSELSQEVGLRTELQTQVSDRKKVKHSYKSDTLGYFSFELNSVHKGEIITITDQYGGCIELLGTGFASTESPDYQKIRCIRKSYGSWKKGSTIADVDDTNAAHKLRAIYFDQGTNHIFVSVGDYTAISVEGIYSDLQFVETLPDTAKLVPQEFAIAQYDKNGKDIADTYATKDELANAYVTKTDVANTYATKADVTNTYATKTELTSNSNFIFTCSTAQGTAAKTVSAPGFKLVTGACVRICFANGNSVAVPYLNVNGTGAKEIVTQDGQKLTAPHGSSVAGTYNWDSRVILELMYDGTAWVVLGNPIVKKSIDRATKFENYSENHNYEVHIDGYKRIYGSVYYKYQTTINLPIPIPIVASLSAAYKPGDIMIGGTINAQTQNHTSYPAYICFQEPVNGEITKVNFVSETQTCMSIIYEITGYSAVYGYGIK